MTVRRYVAALGLFGLLLLNVACEPDRNDITAQNKEYAGQWRVLSETRQADGKLVVRVKVDKLSETATIARNIAAAMANVAQHGLVVEVLGPEDAPTAAPRQTLRWPGDIDYRAG